MRKDKKTARAHTKCRVNWRVHNNREFSQYNYTETTRAQCMEIRRKIDRHQCWSGFGSNWVPQTGGGNIPHSTRYLDHPSRSHLGYNSCDNATVTKQPLLFYSQCHHYLAVGALRAYRYAIGCRLSTECYLTAAAPRSKRIHTTLFAILVTT